LRIGLNHQAPHDVEFALDAVAALERAGRALEGLGHYVLEVGLPLAAEDLLTPRRVYLTQTCAQAAADAPELERLIGRAPHPGEMEPINLAAIERGRAMTVGDYLAAVRAGHDFSRRFAKLWEEVDVLLTPTLAHAPPRLGSFPTDHQDVDEHVARMTRFAPFAAVFNVTGGPALVMPVGQSADGLPLAVQLAGKIGDDGLLLRLAQACEAPLRELFPTTTPPLPR
jgi:amidase